MHWPWLNLAMGPLFLAAGVSAGIVLSTLASSADANRASPAGELPVPFEAKSPPPSATPASLPEPPKENVTLFPPLALCTKSCVMKSNAGAVLDAPRNVVVTVAALTGTVTAPARQVANSTAIPAIPASDGFFNNRVPFREEVV